MRSLPRSSHLSSATIKRKRKLCHGRWRVGNGYCESFNSKLRGEFLNGEIFYSLRELRVLAERWRVHYNTIRPDSLLGYRSPAPETWR
jgi:transposase InsO family protein